MDVRRRRRLGAVGTGMAMGTGAGTATGGAATVTVAGLLLLRDVLCFLARFFTRSAKFFNPAVKAG